MASKTFIDYDVSIPIDAAWANDVDYLTYDIFSFADGNTALTAKGSLTVEGAFTSVGIDDNATSTQVTIDDSSTDFINDINITKTSPLIEMVADNANDTVIGFHEIDNTIGFKVWYDGDTNHLKFSGGNGSYTDYLSIHRDNGIPLFTPTTGQVDMQVLDDGSSVGPELLLTRRSDNPATNDNLGVVYFRGQDSSASYHNYAGIGGIIRDTNDGNEDGSVVLKASINGTLTNKLFVGDGVYLGTTTGGDQGTDTINASGLYKDGVEIHPLTSGTAQATTSGTSIDFTGIPSWVKRVTVLLSGVSTSGTSNPVLRIGDSGGIVSTGYLGSAGYYASTTQLSTLWTSGFGCASGTAAASLRGRFVLELIDSSTNTWICTSNIGRSNSAIQFHGGGSKALSGVLDRIRLTTVGGTDTFDAGTMNILYE